MTRTSHRVTFTGGSGYELAGIVDTPATQDTSGNPNVPSAPRPVAVFSHCFTCNKDLKAIVRISRRLAERGVTVLRYDMTGLGGSEGDFSRTNFSTNLSDLRAAVEFATQTLGPVTALIGHSFGGAASLAFASSIGSSPLGDRTNDVLRHALRCVVTLAAPSDTTHLAALLARMNPEIEASGVGDVTIGGIRWTIRREMLADFRRHSLPDWIATIDRPVLLFQSPDDATVGFDHALRIMSLVQSASGGAGVASLVALPGADHLLSDSVADIEFVADTTAVFLHRYAVAP